MAASSTSLTFGETLRPVSLAFLFHEYPKLRKDCRLGLSVRAGQITRALLYLLEIYRVVATFLRTTPG